MNEIHALSGAYAVDALDGHEREMFEQHLLHCSTCRDEVDSLREAAAALGEAAATTPPPGLRGSVMAAIATTRPLPPLSGDVQGPDEEEPTRRRSAPADPDADTAAESEPVAEPTPIAAKRRRWGTVPMLAAAAAIAIGAVGVAVTQPWASDPPGVTVAQQVHDAPDAREVTMTFPDGAAATLVHSAQVGRAILETHDMPAPPEGRGYQLWLQVGEEMVPAGVMPAQATQTFLLEGDATEAVAAAISVEPAGGSEQPTTDPIAFFDFQGRR